MHLLSMQVMLKSHVVKGYWCPCPKELRPHLPGVDSDLLFETPERRVAPARFNAKDYDAGDGTWGVVLLHKGGSVSFSGGWRGFAIDQVLQPTSRLGFGIDQLLKSGIIKVVLHSEVPHRM